MQATKDTFLKTLAARLATVNPARTVTLDGVTRPAVVAVENETPVPAETVLEAFLLSWQGAEYVTAETGLMFLDCKVSYASKGTDAMMRADRGRTVTAMAAELRQIVHSRFAAKCDYTQTPPAALGTNIFWTLPAMAPESDKDGVLEQTATIRVFFFPEVG
jgi:hypothetical protein